MSDISTEIAAPTKRRGRQPRRRIDLPNGDWLEPRAEFADGLGTTERTVRRMNVPTTYIANVAYVPHNASMQVIAERVRRRNEPPKKRRGHR
jgi:hypothetical protein